MSNGSDGGWSGFKAKVQGVLKDLTTLEVATLSGKIELGQDTEISSFNDLLQSVSKGAKLQANVQVVAYTHLDLDHDAVHFVAEGAESRAKLLEAHSRMVTASAEARRGFLEFAQGLFG